MELTVKTKDGRTFCLLSVLPYTRRDGTASAIAIWHGTCRKCGDAFELITPAHLGSISKTKSFSRVHCDAHKLRRTKKVESQAVNEKTTNLAEPYLALAILSNNQPPAEAGRDHQENQHGIG